MNTLNTIQGLQKMKYDLTSGNKEIFFNPGAVRTLEFAIQHLQVELQDRPAMAGKKWSDVEDMALTAEWLCERPLEEVARSHQRSASAVAMRNWNRSAPVVKLLLENAGKLPLPS
jgi:hypothetical protein